MFDSWLWALVVAVAVVGVGVPLVALTARRRWGKLVRAEDTGEANYRTGPGWVRAPGGRVPREVTFAATVGGIWGAVTAIVFVPCGAFVSHYLTFGLYRPAYALLTASWLVTVSGVVLAVGLLLAGVRLVRRSAGAIPTASAMVRYTYAHHGAVFLTYAACIATLGSDAMGVVVILALPCAFGVVVGRMLRNATDRLRLADAPDDDA